MSHTVLRIAGLRIAGLTIVAMIAFAANSVLARLALGDNAIGPWSYTLLRLLSGAAVLAVIAGLRLGPAALRKGNWAGGVALLAYAGLFSLAYRALGAAAGALILFAFVQLTMLGWGLKQGERLSAVQACGLVLAVGALTWLLVPGVIAADYGGPVSPPAWASVAMAVSGIAWGAYSLIGRGAVTPTAVTAGNFWRASLIALPLSLPVFLLLPETGPGALGIVCAIASGAIASGLGYAVWYAALPGLKAMQAGIAQLSVPAIAAAGGIAFLAEPLTWRFAIATALVLTGVALATLAKRRG
ncbi:DMT family transporter [Aquisalinus flavus]|uniref:EamA domain-containing protein n=1 Tax=Aquisalinus flavus TaxID=1526572 RepID=A0A8J2V4B9_9PROT|nr:DMT family transporter [Aquisalinus flavus]MBD0427135.1 DMT family transporter [Aquisalinus flavus]UNE46955.1 DMT family transporter [Aquisalinus flavus]GGC98637.1 hypothetical protein GCM10011342_04480 [Aquisalinus flavus]